jgi:glutaconate CoA-transferase subunit A
MDELFCMAADKAFMSAEKIIPTANLLDEGTFHTLKINRMMVQGVVHAPGGAHFTECPPDYERDEAFQKEYAATAKDPAAWEAFKAKYLDVTEAEYQKAVAK